MSLTAADWSNENSPKESEEQHPEKGKDDLDRRPARFRPHSAL
jgi:hypothetical protein